MKSVLCIEEYRKNAWRFALEGDSIGKRRSLEQVKRPSSICSPLQLCSQAVEVSTENESEREERSWCSRDQELSLSSSLSLIFLFHWRHLKISKIFNGSDSFTPSTCMRQRIHRRFIRSLFSFVPFFWCKINHFYS